ncbi:MAG: DUF4240 domain-containing protein [Verrucomicrobiales bacterium]|nr:DUF4240 domain-containing protein [Verrucomicrobiales bacterium]
MTDARFWQIIAESLERSQNTYGKDAIGQVAAELPSFVNFLNDQELLAFCQRYEEKSDFAYDGVIWAVLTLVSIFVNKVGVSDDTFMDIRDNLVAQGEEIYDRLVKDPDSLLEYQEPLNYCELYIESSCWGVLEERKLSRPERSPLKLRRPFPDWGDIGFFRAYLPKIYKFVSERDPEFWFKHTDSA